MIFHFNLYKIVKGTLGLIIVTSLLLTANTTLRANASCLADATSTRDAKVKNCKKIRSKYRRKRCIKKAATVFGVAKRRCDKQPYPMDTKTESKAATTKPVAVAGGKGDGVIPAGTKIKNVSSREIGGSNYFKGMLAKDTNVKYRGMDIPCKAGTEISYRNIKKKDTMIGCYLSKNITVKSGPYNVPLSANSRIDFARARTYYLVMGILSAETEMKVGINTIPFAANKSITFYPNGDISGGSVTKAYTIKVGNLKVPVGHKSSSLLITRDIIIDTKGQPVLVHLGGDLVVTAGKYKFKMKGGNDLRFHMNGAVSSGTLASTVTIDERIYRSGKQIRFKQDGTIY